MDGGKNVANNTLRVRVARVSREAEDIQSYELISTDGSPLPSFEPGAHLDVHVPGGFVRQYSLCNDATETHRYVIAVQRELGVPVKLVGLGEGPDDLAPFDPEQFVDGLLGD